MANSIRIGRFGLVASLLSNFVLVFLSFALYGEGTTRGIAYSYVQPDDRTFGVWSLIYGLHCILVVSQVCKSSLLSDEARGWLGTNYVLNGAWLIVNGAANDGFSYWLAVVVLCLNLWVLVNAYKSVQVDYTRSDLSTLHKAIAFSPLSCNLAWVLLAAFVNASNTLYDPASKSKVVIGGADWAIAVVGLATWFACYVAVLHMDIPYALVSVWAFLGVHRNQVNSDGPIQGSKELDTMAISGAVAVLVACLLGVALHICSKPSRNNGNKQQEATPLL